jgi:hypothetical protein
MRESATYVSLVLRGPQYQIYAKPKNSTRETDVNRGCQSRKLFFLPAVLFMFFMQLYCSIIQLYR